MTMLSANHLSKSYAKRPVVKDVSFSVNEGEVVGLLGPNGAGKTTCFYMTTGLVTQDGGQIILDDEDITDSPMHGRARKGLGYLPQEPSIFRKLSVRDNILAILETRKDLTHSQRQQKLESLLNEFHITHLTESDGMSLSGGERRRVEIARALATDPKFILLDEPFAGVDPLAVADLQGLIKSLRDRGMGILITDHNVRETLAITDRATILNDGAILASGRADHVSNDPLVRRYYLGEDFQL